MDIVAIYNRDNRPFRGDLARRAGAGAAPVERVVEGEVLGGGSDSEASWRQYRHARETLNAVPDLESRRALAAYLATAATPRHAGLIDLYA